MILSTHFYMDIHFFYAINAIYLMDNIAVANFFSDFDFVQVFFLNKNSFLAKPF